MEKLHTGRFSLLQNLWKTGKLSTFIIPVLMSCHPPKNKNVLETVKLPAGEVKMFNNENLKVSIGELEVMKYEVTNSAFKKFVDGTHYITTAERNGESMIFDYSTGKWILQPGADWNHPKGKESNIHGKEFYPVVHVSYEDACAYCEWINMRLPYESEWEYVSKINEKDNDQKYNSWQGIFPYKDEGKDGFKGTSPVGIFSSDENAICDLKGNVWEWCLDYYHQDWPELVADIEPNKRITGPLKPYSENVIYDTLRVIKGGSFLCSENYCEGYKSLKRKSADPKLSYEHIGFRCVKE